MNSGKAAVKEKNAPPAAERENDMFVIKSSKITAIYFYCHAAAGRWFYSFAFFIFSHFAPGTAFSAYLWCFFFLWF